MSAPCPCCQADVAPAVRRRGGGRSLARKTAASVAGAITDVLQNEELAARPGLLQGLDPRVKLLTLVLFAVTASLVHAVWALLALVAVTLVLAAASRVGVGSFARKVWLSAGLLALLVALPSALSVFTPGTAVISLGPLVAHRAGAHGRRDAGHARRRRRRVRPADHLDDALARPASGAERPADARRRRRHPGDDAEADPHPAAHRGADPPGAREPHADARHNASEPGLGDERMAFVVRKSMKTADDVYDAMLSRGFTGAMPSLARLRLRARDWMWTAASVALCAAVLYADRGVGP